MHDLLQFIVKHWLLVGAFVVVLVLVIAEEAKSRNAGGPRISPERAIQLMNQGDGTLILDIRARNAFMDGHIINAKNIQAQDLATQQNKIQKYKDKAVIVVCNQGRSALAVATKLKQQGFKNVQVLAGGMAAWNSANLPIVKGK